VEAIREKKNVIKGGDSVGGKRETKDEKMLRGKEKSHEEGR